MSESWVNARDQPGAARSNQLLVAPAASCVWRFPLLGGSVYHLRALLTGQGVEALLLEGKASSIGELLAEMDRISSEMKPDFDSPEELWYRGQASVSWPLLPNLYRPSISRFHYHEPSLVDRFVALGTPLAARPPASDWEWYFLARHHGLPSRLLDWTESLLAAVYFCLYPYSPADRLALDDQLRDDPPPPAFDDSCPALWVLDAGSLNAFAVGFDGIVVPGGRVSAPYLPDELERAPIANNAKPIAILPGRANSRIVAQQGTFTIHGHETTSLDAIAGSVEDVKLAKIVLDRSRIPWFLGDLRTFGLSRVSLFPDLDSVAEHVSWIYQSKE